MCDAARLLLGVGGEEMVEAIAIDALPLRRGERARDAPALAGEFGVGGEPHEGRRAAWDKRIIG